MPIQQLPLMKGVGKDYRSADYVDFLPVNMLATPKEVLNSSGYLRSFPGIDKKSDVAGVSRGGMFNTAESIVYRVMGTSLYRGETVFGDVSGSDRVSMACSYISQAVAHLGIMNLYRYDGTVKQLDNWPEGEDRTVKEWTSNSGAATDNFFTVPDDIGNGEITIYITPKTTTGTAGTMMTIGQNQWGEEISQETSTTAPWLTKVLVVGEPVAGSTVNISYIFTKPSAVTGTNATEFDVHFIIPTYVEYDIGYVRDITRLRGRYVWAKKDSDTFGVTDLEDESHPDRYRALYRAESQPDGIMGVDTWRDFIVTFGTSTTEYFSITGSTDATSAIYVAQPSLMVAKGIAGTHCKAQLGGSHVIISHPATGAPSVYVIDSGNATPIATATIEKIIRSYSYDDLSTGVMETLRFDSHELLLIHLPNHVLCYDASSSQNGPQWAVLCTGLDGEPHSSIDYIYEGNTIGCGSKVSPVTGALNFAISSQFGSHQEHILYTPLFKADNARVFDFELEASTGVAQIADKLFLSVTVDGINYGQEVLISNNKPFVYDKRVLMRRIGRVRKNIGMKVRVVTSSPVTLSGAQVRIE